MEQNQISCDSVVYDQLPPISSKYPWLVAQNLESEEEGTGEQFFFTINDASKCHYRCKIPEVVGRRIRGCFHGWVILSNDPHNVLWCLWNPTTSKVIELPSLILEDGDSESIAQCCLSSPPDDPSSVLLLTRSDKSTFVFCSLDSKRKGLKWAEMSYSKQLKRITGDGDLLTDLTCCDGKVYALNADNTFDTYLIKVDIEVKNCEVLIKLFFLGGCPFAAYNQYSGGDICFLKGCGRDLFYILVGYRDRAKKKIGFVSLFKLDMTRVDWKIINQFKDRDTSRQHLDMSSEKQKERKIMIKIRRMWKEMLDIKDAIFFVDLVRDYSVFYNPSIASDIGGYIHIRSEVGNIIQSYHLKDKTISVSSMPSPVLPTSHISVWEFKRLEDDHGKNSNQSFLLNLPFEILKMIMELCECVDYKNFRAACKRCHLAAPETPLQRLQTYSHFLVVLDNDRHFTSFTHPMLGFKHIIRDIPLTMKDDRIRCSSYGWLLFYANNRGLVFYNPFTDDIITLPFLNFYFGQVCISASPTSPDCMVVGFFGEDVYIHFVDREQSWRKLSVGVDSTSMRFSTFYGQDIYVLCKNGELHVFRDLDKENYSLEKVVAEIPRSGSNDEYFLTKCDQHLLLVRKMENIFC